jgi:hypothetical protein
MERDPHISKLIKESGVKAAPDNFTALVMDKIETEPLKQSYKPLIGRGGRLTIILVVLAVIVLAIIFSDPSGETFSAKIHFPQLEGAWPQLNLKLDFLKQINISTGVASALLAMLVLILSDAGLSRRRFSQ